MKFHKITQELKNLLNDKILILDGAMGTMIQEYKLDEDDFRGELFKSHKKPLKGNNDLLSLSRAQIIKEIHLKYLNAPCDIIETNTFNATKIAQSDYKLESHVYDINYQAAKIARSACAEIMTKNPKRKCTLLFDRDIK